MLFGGSRSGKTFLNVWALCARAIKAEGSRHAALRHRFNHIKSAIVYDTFPKVMKVAFPDVPYRLDKQDWFVEFPNGSQLWFGGLDDKERTEKILGQEYATMFLNECSQISWHARNIALTRLAQNTPLRLRMLYDCNPPLSTFWTYRVFEQLKDPQSLKPLPNPEDYCSLLMNPTDNAENLPAQYLKSLENLPTRQRLRFFEGKYGSAQEGALWTFELIDKARVLDNSMCPDFVRIVIAVDPSGTSGEEDSRSDKVGIAAVGLGTDGEAYVLEDLTMQGGPAQWGRAVAAAFDRHDADCVVAETNFGGDMVRHVIQTARPGTPFKKVTASRGKHVRAEPVAALYEQGKVHHVGVFSELEDQLCSFTTFGYMGDRSPDRADAVVWAITELFPKVVSGGMARRGSYEAVAETSPLDGL